MLTHNRKQFPLMSELEPVVCLRIRYYCGEQRCIDMTVMLKKNIFPLLIADLVSTRIFLYIVASAWEKKMALQTTALLLTQQQERPTAQHYRVAAVAGRSSVATHSYMMVGTNQPDCPQHIYTSPNYLSQQCT